MDYIVDFKFTQIIGNGFLIFGESNENFLITKSLLSLHDGTETYKFLL